VLLLLCVLSYGQNWRFVAKQGYVGIRLRFYLMEYKPKTIIVHES
jgi:hypothetical protein